MFRLLTAQGGFVLADMRFNFENCYSIYRTAGYQSSGEWKQSPFDAVLDAVQRGMIVMPAGVPIAIPMFA